MNFHLVVRDEKDEEWAVKEMNENEVGVLLSPRGIPPVMVKSLSAIRCMFNIVACRSADGL